MSVEASHLLNQTFQKRIDAICQANLETLTKFSDIKQSIEFIKAITSKTDISIHLMSYYKSERIEKAILKSLKHIVHSQKEKKQEKPIVQTILEDINIERKQSLNLEHQPIVKQASSPSSSTTPLKAEAIAKNLSFSEPSKTQFFKPLVLTHNNNSNVSPSTKDQTTIQSQQKIMNFLTCLKTLTNNQNQTASPFKT